MAAPAPEHVRNIVLVGQDGAGKTSLAEAMLFVSGKTPRMGTTHDGKSYLDYDPEEIKRKFTISTSIAPIPYKDYKINVLDTSGHPDFIGDTLATMQAAEMALFVVDAVAGPQVMTTKLWREAEGMRLVKNTMGYLCKIHKPYLIWKLGWQCVGRYAGYFLGKRYQKLGRRQILKCTMSPYYWKRIWSEK